MGRGHTEDSSVPGLGWVLGCACGHFSLNCMHVLRTVLSGSCTSLSFKHTQKRQGGISPRKHAATLGLSSFYTSASQFPSKTSPSLLWLQCDPGRTQGQQWPGSYKKKPSGPARWHVSSCGRSLSGHIFYLKEFYFFTWAGRKESKTNGSVEHWPDEGGQKPSLKTFIKPQRQTRIWLLPGEPWAACSKRCPSGSTEKPHATYLPWQKSKEHTKTFFLDDWGYVWV